MATTNFLLFRIDEANNITEQQTSVTACVYNSVLTMLYLE